MENIFIPANQLPEAEGDEVSVLCVENGELKQKAASGLGATQYDIVVRFTPAYDAETGETTATAEIISGSYDAVMQKLDAGVMPMALVIENGTLWNGGIKSVAESTPCWRNDEDGEGILFWGFDSSYFLRPDGTVIVE